MEASVVEVPSERAELDVRALERRIAESHHYIRALMQVLITWFTVFMTVNYATMGWLLKDGLPLAGGPAVSGLALTFFVQNVFGILACRVAKTGVERLHGQVLDWEGAITPEEKPEPRTSYVPALEYVDAIKLMIWGLVPIAAVWLALIVYALVCPSSGFKPEAQKVTVVGQQAGRL